MDAKESSERTQPAIAGMAEVVVRRDFGQDYAAARKSCEECLTLWRHALGVSEPYASLIRAKRYLPHPRHWLALARLVGVSGELPSAEH